MIGITHTAQGDECSVVTPRPKSKEAFVYSTAKKIAYIKFDLKFRACIRHLFYDAKYYQYAAHTYLGSR